ncbi:TPA: hypothetical protein SMN07_003188, partial [Proteus mirabilis]|nr:hypothetical protein [Proteus mirabilis]
MNIIFLEKNSNEKVQLQPHAKHTITAKAGDVYQLIDSNIQLSPLDIQAHRKSDDLILSSKEQNIEVVIKDFWLECQPGEQQCYAILNVLDSNGVMGQATITQDGPVLEHLVAGEAGTLSDNDDEIGLFLWVAGSIGSALAIFLANRNHGGGNGVVDTTPVVTIPEATDGVNADELKDGVQTEVSVPGGSAAGDTLTLTITKPDDSIETVEHTLTADEVTAGKANVIIPADEVTADGNYSVTAEITDPAGNTSGQGKPTDFMVDTQIPGDTDGDGVVDTTPVVTIPEATDGVNADELKDGVQTEVTVPGGSAAGDTLTLTITKPDGSTDTVEHTLTADEVTAGKADVTIPADKATPDGNYSVKAEITDPAGNTSGEGKATDFTVDTVAPSTPVLNAEDNGSVSVELPGDANKGDTVEITFEDEKGDKQTVTMEKGDNGWTSSDPNLIPDSQGNNTAIPSDNVKDNSEVTAIAKDPSGNESAPATATSKTDVLPTVSISVDTTSVNDNGDKISADASVSGEITEVPATIEDKDDTTGLVYTVALDYVAAQDVTVTITLTNDAGHASAPDYSTLAGSQHDGKIALHGDTGKVTYDGASTVTVVIPAGSKSVSFIVDPTMEANQNAFNAEGMEKVVATITGTSNNATAVTDTVNNAGASATGVIYDGN